MEIIVNVVEEVIDTRHVAYYVNRNYLDRDTIVLYEVFEAFYNHPNSNGYSLISRIEQRQICRYKIHEPKAAPLLVLENAQNNIKLFAKNLLVSEEI